MNIEIQSNSAYCDEMKLQKYFEMISSCRTLVVLQKTLLLLSNSV